MKYSNKEIKDLFNAWVLISIAFAILFSNDISDLFGFINILGISALTAGIGFLLHELMHKYVAQSYGLFAEFQAFYKMLFLAIGFSFFGFIFAAPGAVMIKGQITKERNGKISLAGPVTNIVLSVVFLIPLLLGFESLFFDLGFRINSLLAIFNLIPIMPFDGAKIKEWSNTVFFTTVAVAGSLFVLSFLM